MTDKEKFRKEVEKLKSNLIYGACSSQIAMETRCKEEAYDEVLALLDTIQEEPVSIWHDASEKSNEPEEIVIINPSDNTGEVLTRCTGVYLGRIWAYTSELLKLYNPCKIGKALQEEPVSEDLDKAVVEYMSQFSGENYYNSPWAMDSTGMAMPKELARFGAKWQKAKDESTTEDLGEYINELSKQFPEMSFAKLSRIAVRVAKWQNQQDQSAIELAEDHAMLAGMEKMKEEMMAKAIDGYVIEDIEEGNGDFLLSAEYLPKSMGLKDRQKVKVIVIKEN